MPSAHPVLVELESPDRLVGPESNELEIRSEEIAGTVTGGGSVALVAADQGLRSVWTGEVLVTRELEVKLDGRTLSGSSDFRVGAGSWSRVTPLSDGMRLRECGLLPDVGTAAVVQWTLVSGRTGSTDTDDGQLPTRNLSVSLRTNSGASLSRVELPLEVDVPATAMITTRANLDRSRSLLHPLRARELQRAGRGATQDADGLRIKVDGTPVRQWTQALRIMDDAPLSFGPKGPEGPFFAGWVDATPRYLVADELLQFGHAALASGRASLALAAFRSRTRPGEVPDDALSEAWVRWAGAPQLLSHTDGISTRPMIPSRDPPEPATTVPQWRFPGDPDAPTIGDASHDRTLRSTELVRFWIENMLGIRPDAPYGRLRMGPVWREDWSTLEVRGIRMGDSVVRLDCHREKDSFTFLLRQDGGRVPVNVVFEPCIPLAGVRRVLIGGEAAEVGIATDDTGTRIHCQFPLDPERSVTIVGTA